jgi:hypothetical protein
MEADSFFSDGSDLRRLADKIDTSKEEGERELSAIQQMKRQREAPLLEELRKKQKERDDLVLSLDRIETEIKTLNGQLSAISEDTNEQEAFVRRKHHNFVADAHKRAHSWVRGSSSEMAAAEEHGEVMHPRNVRLSRRPPISDCASPADDSIPALRYQQSDKLHRPDSDPDLGNGSVVSNVRPFFILFTFFFVFMTKGLVLTETILA